jgi:hypothetical protein
MNLRSLVAGAGLLGIAAWQYFQDGPNMIVLILGVASLGAFCLGAAGKALPSMGEVTGTANFARDPGGAIVDAASDRLSGFLGLKEEEKKSLNPLDPEAIIANYEELKRAEPETPAPKPPASGFGRKGL